MHICYVTSEYPKPGFPHGGVGSFVKTIAAELVKRGFRVSVVGMNYVPQMEEYSENGVAVHRLVRYPLKGLSWWNNKNAINRKIREIHARNPIDIVETAELGLAFIQKIKGIRYVIRLHGGHHFFSESENRKINFWKGFQEKKSFSKADAFIAVSKYVQSHTNEYLSYRDKKVALISNPIDVALFQPISVAVVPGRIVFAGTVCEKKGVRQLIQSFKLVKQQCPHATLEIYGRDWRYPDGRSYLKMLQETELPKLGIAAKDVFFRGAISHAEIPLKYAHAEVCVFPSHMETQGLVAPEAMAAGKTVVFTKLGPGPETIDDGVTGLLADPHDPVDIASKVIWVLSNKEQSREMGIKGAEFARRKYGLGQIATQNIAFYESLLA